jgi:subtilisin-like proprotein convertase family protein
LLGRVISLSLAAFVLVGALGLISRAAAPNPAAMATLHEADAARTVAAGAVSSGTDRARVRAIQARGTTPEAALRSALVVLAPAPLKSAKAVETEVEPGSATAAELKEVESKGEAAPGPDEFSVVNPNDMERPPHVPDNFLANSPFSAAQGLVSEREPNDTAATATPLGGTNVAATGNIYRLSNGPTAAIGDIDTWSFSGTAGDRVYAATMTSWAPSSSTDTTLELVGTDGTTIIETDLDDGALATASSSIAGTTLPATGTFFLRVRQSSNSSRIAPYFLHFRLQSGSPTPETEANDTSATANPLPANGWVSGARNPAVATEQDWFSFSAGAGDTVYLSLDLDPERDNVQWNGRVGIALFGDLGNQILVVDDASVGSVTNPLSEALFMTVKATGTYYAFVDSATAATGGPTATYNLSVSVLPATPIGTNCTVYTSTDVPKTIGPGAVTTDSTITVPGNPRIADLNVSITLNHILMTDVDAALISPAGNENSLFTDLGAATQTQLDLDIDDEAGIPPLFTVLRGEGFQPEVLYRLNWLKGELGGGTWTLRLRDDTANTSGGNLTAWSITICEPPAPAVCAGTTVTVLSRDFEADNGGFTPSAATPAPWQWGTPTVAPIATCSSGVNCWKTNLTGLYSASANQDLVSPTMNLSGLGAPITVSWAQKYQLESASFDTFWLDVREVGPTNATNLFQFLDATMTDSVGSPATTLQETAGWGLVTRDISAYANKPAVQLRWGFVSDTSGQFAGLAIDDVTVTACCTPASCDDNNPCTDDACDAVLGCTHVNNDAASCSDGNDCTGPDFCSAGTCVPGANPCEDNNACTVDVCDGQGGCTYTQVDCNDNNVCTDDSCIPATGCAHANNTDPCSDGNICTLGDTCAGGVCVSGPGPTPVQFCNSTLITIPAVGAATPYPSPIIVTGQPSYLCSTTVDLNGITHTFPDDLDILLARLTGSNALIMSDVGGGTDVVSLSLTLSDAAATALPDSAALVAGTFQPTNIGAGDVFPAPAPAPTGGSALSVFNGTNPNGTWNLWVDDQFTPDSGTMAGWCVNLVSVCTVDADCNDGNVCTDDACVNSSCTHTNNTVLCDDGNACTSGDTCTGGVCVGGNPPNCDDSDACTTDSCNPGTGLCEHVAVVCNDNNSCTDDTCVSPTTGCVYTPNDSNTCSDNNACTQTDSCVNGTCVGTNPIDCDDANVCTTDSCAPASGTCAHANNTNACDDGDVCTTDDTCGPNPIEVFTETWDAATPPALSPGWTSAVIAGTGNPWTTDGTSFDSPPNSALGFDGAVVADQVLDSPPIAIGSAAATLSFRNRWSFESAASCFDAGVLEIKIGAGPFTDIVTAGGSFGSGGYTGTVSPTFSNPLASRSAWCNASAGYPSYLTTDVNLPAAAAGQTIVLRWRIGTDTSVAAAGQNIDTIVVTDSVNQCNQSTPTDCSDINPCTDDSCNPQTGCVNTNNTSACDDGNACTAGEICGGGVCQSGTPITTPPETQDVRVAADKVTYSWSAATFATRYDVVRGGLAALPVGPGGGDEFCFDDLAVTTVGDSTVPDPDKGFWYLSRGENTCGNGTYGTQGVNGGPGAPRITTTCP